MAMLFLFSGFAKSISPFGLSIQLGDYLSAMSLDFLSPLAPMLAILLPVFEMVLGAMLLLGLYRCFSAWAVTLFMGFFTLLTLWIAVYNPVKDCGCFGDLLKISNWETFIKNAIFLIPTVIVFLNREGRLSGDRARNSKRSWVKVLIVTLLFAILPIYTTFSLPIIDSTPYKVGTNLYNALNDGTPDITTTTLIYKNLSSGETQEFEINDPEWQDESRWEFVDSKTVVLEQGNPPTISELPMIDFNGQDRSAEILSFEGQVILFAVQNPNEKRAEIEAVINNYSRESSVETLVVVLHSSVETIEFAQSVELLATDQTILRTIIQNQGGGYLIINNKIVMLKSVL